MWSEGPAKFDRLFDAQVSKEARCVSANITLGISSMMQMSKVQALTQKLAIMLVEAAAARPPKRSLCRPMAATNLSHEAARIFRNRSCARGKWANEKRRKYHRNWRPASGNRVCVKRTPYARKYGRVTAPRTFYYRHRFSVCGGTSPLTPVRNSVYLRTISPFISVPHPYGLVAIPY